MKTSWLARDTARRNVQKYLSDIFGLEVSVLVEAEGLVILQTTRRGFDALKVSNILLSFMEPLTREASLLSLIFLACRYCQSPLTTHSALFQYIMI